MTYNVFSGTLNPTQSISSSSRRAVTTNYWNLVTRRF